MSAGSAIGIKVLRIAIGIPVGIATKKGIEKAWLAARPEDPPRKAGQRNVVAFDAIAWAALSAAGVVAAELITRRSSEAAFRVISGTEPPPAKQTKAERKAIAKAEKKSTKKALENA